MDQQVGQAVSKRACNHLPKKDRRIIKRVIKENTKRGQYVGDNAVVAIINGQNLTSKPVNRMNVVLTRYRMNLKVTRANKVRGYYGRKTTAPKRWKASQTKELKQTKAVNRALVACIAVLQECTRELKKK